ncbi:hypothetical protein PILCRDRAFT_12869 [Piloderma croceum F 1598]|uniref:Nephrocystin 3-like N-terminal domain-containing protein n=1 Tax=Piloderma croceum (strain F 1598) TaxID=765440 RepID=A0A0C3AQQ8_PILCF|nr:hypothetical protein PILCRDRAFT_12869 [Piloderma croceum F 1598]
MLQLTLAQKPRRDDQERLKKAFSTAISGLQTALKLIKGISTNAGIGPPGLQAGISGLLFILDAIQKTFQNAADIEQLAMRIQKLSLILQKSQDTLSPSVVARMDRLSEEWNGDIEQLKMMVSRSFMKRLIYYNNDAKAISDHIQSITWSIQNLTVESMLAIEFTLDELGRFLKRGLEGLERKVDGVGEQVACGFQQQNMALDMKDGHPAHTDLARFNYEGREPCLDGTRTNVLDQIFAWISADTRVDPDAVDSRIFWINGSAGTGKTTIAYTVARTCQERGILGASFFCSHDKVDCSNPKLIFTTIAYQLGQFFPPFKDKVTAVLKSNPEIAYSDLSFQLKELIVEPLRTIGDSFPFCVVVIDALDECKDDTTISVILASLSIHVTELSSLKFLITSRPEQQITSGFDLEGLDPATRRLVLHEIELGVVRRDIEHYLTTNLGIIRKSYNLADSWPSTADIQALSSKSSGLFIFAATSIKFIGDRNYSEPPNQLAKLLRSTMPILESFSPDLRLDQLYTEVLTHAFPSISSRLAGRLKIILGTIMLLRDPLSPHNLELLLNVNSEQTNSSRSSVRGTLVHLHSVVIVPDDDDQVIRLLHPSFSDFLTSNHRCRDPKLVVDTSTQHTLLAHACLGVMKDLKRNICGIESPTIHNSEVTDLPARIRRYIPAHLQYACRHWASHLTNAMVSDILLDLLKDLCSESLLYLVEVCSLLGDLRSLLLSLDIAQRALAANLGKEMSDITILLHDCERFVREFFAILSTSALQTYHSALIFTPSETLFHKMYRHELPLATRMQNMCETKWNSCLRTMEGHSNVIMSVTFSPDGTHIVSGSYDSTLRIWDALSGAHLNTLKGHSDGVTSVAFSPDGTNIVSGSYDNTLRLWNAVNGAHINTLKGHSDRITSVAFSPDGTNIVSGSYDNTLRLWDAVNGAHINTLEGHSDRITTVSFSPDGAHIVSGSYDNTLRLWDAVSGARLNVLKGHSDTIRSVTFSPDGTHLVSGADDNTLRLWDAASGTYFNTVKGHSDSIRSVGFSSDGTRIVSGSHDNTLRLWNAVSRTHLNTLKGHFHPITSVTFSPDGTQIVSGSHDNTLRLWDAVSSAHLQVSTLKVHSYAVTSVAFSPNGTHVVSGSYDNILRLWDAVSGAQINTLKGHSYAITSVVFSPDGAHIVSASQDKTLRLWDAVNGAHLNTLKGHLHSITSVTFSPDGTQIVSGSLDKTLRLWDAVGGAHLNTLKGHAYAITSVAISPNGIHIVSGSHDNTLRLWDAVSGAHLNTLEGHSDTIRSVAFSPDGTHIVSVSMDKTLRRWDAVSGMLLNTLEGILPWGKAIGDQKEALCYFMDDGWIYLANPCQRLCWIPVTCRGVVASRGNRLALGTNDGRVVIIDFSGIMWVMSLRTDRDQGGFAADCASPNNENYRP